MRTVRRSYTEVRIQLAAPRTWQILLDGKPVMTPAGKTLTLPTAALADAVAEEWRTQGDELRPELMPLNRLANTAIDRVGVDRRPAVAELLNFASHDLLCFRAPGPDALVERQSAAWDPLLEWANERYGISIKTSSRIAPFSQSQDDINALESFILRYDNFLLTGIVAAANILGSAILALAMAEGRIDPAEAFSAAELDAIYQSEIWGEDPEFSKRNQRKSSEVERIHGFLRLTAAV